MTPEEEEAHLKAMLAGDDESVEEEKREKGIQGEEGEAGDQVKVDPVDEEKKADDKNAAEKGQKEETEAEVSETAGEEGTDVEASAKKETETRTKGDASADGTGVKDSEGMPSHEQDSAGVSTASKEPSETPTESKPPNPPTPGTPSRPPRSSVRSLKPNPISAPSSNAASLSPLAPAAEISTGSTESTEPSHTTVHSEPVPVAIPNSELETLRTSLSSAQSTISSQIARVGDLTENYERLSEQHKFLVAAKEAVEERLRDETSKREAAEESAEAAKAQMEALRGQVEQARRGVMTLQKQEKERKRASMMGMPGGGVPGIVGASAGTGTGAGASAVGGAQGQAGVGLGLNDVWEESETLKDGETSQSSRQTKRSSMLSKNNRRSSVSDEGVGGLGVSPNITDRPSSTFAPASTVSPPPSSNAPARPGLRELRLGTGQNLSSSPKLSTGAMATSPSTPPTNIDDPYTSSLRDRAVSGTPSFSVDPSILAELEQLRSALAVSQVRLSESEEARQASEDCLKALREFISGSSVADDKASIADDNDTGPAFVDLNDPSALIALKGVKLPPLPTDRDPDEPPESQNMPERKGWGFKMPSWKGTAPTGSLASPSTAAAEPATPRTGMSPPPSIRSSGMMSPTINESEGAAARGYAAAAPLANFVNSWTRGVSSSTAMPATPSAGANEQSADKETPGAAAAATPRGFGAFFRRATNTTTNKDLPSRPEDDTESVGSVGAEKGDEMHISRLPSMSREGSNSSRQDLSERIRNQLQPSPEIKLVGTGTGSGEANEDDRMEELEIQASDSLGTVDSDAPVLRTPTVESGALGRVSVEKSN